LCMLGKSSVTELQPEPDSRVLNTRLQHIIWEGLGILIVSSYSNNLLTEACLLLSGSYAIISKFTIEP
jgi:hypothetical protein